MRLILTKLIIVLLKRPCQIPKKELFLHDSTIGDVIAMKWNVLNQEEVTVGWRQGERNIDCSK